MGQEEWKLLRDHCSRSRYENSFCIRRPNKGRRFFRLCGLANVVFEPSGDNSTGDSRARPITPIITKYYGLLMGRYFTTRDSRFQSCSKFFFRPIKLTLNRVSWGTFDFDFDGYCKRVVSCSRKSRVVSERWMDERVERRRRRGKYGVARGMLEGQCRVRFGIGLIATKPTTQKYSLEFIVPWKSMEFRPFLFCHSYVKFEFYEASRNDLIRSRLQNWSEFFTQKK